MENISNGVNKKQESKKNIVLVNKNCEINEGQFTLFLLLFLKKIISVKIIIQFQEGLQLYRKALILILVIFYFVIRFAAKTLIVLTQKTICGILMIFFTYVKEQ